MKAKRIVYIMKTILNAEILYHKYVETIRDCKNGVDSSHDMLHVQRQDKHDCLV